ncbi:MAG TPA: histidine triad nucleotide-binding protein [Burkholderiales bacterium]|nr:histidine triad nucleotide-binding protein [Burkholderiales bacterium]
MQEANCIFCKIVRGEIPSKRVYEDDLILAFHDIHPVAPVHVLVIPKAHVDTLANALPEHEAALGRMMAVANRLAAEQGSPEGFRLIVNTGRIGRQEVMHVHAHILGGGEPLGPMLPRPRT